MTGAAQTWCGWNRVGEIPVLRAAGERGARLVEAFFWGLFGAAFLLVGAWWAYRFHPGIRLIAVVMAVGSGVLIGSVSYELVEEALKTQTVGRVGLFVLLGAGTFAAGDWLSTGSLTLPTPLRAGQTCVARFGDSATVTVRMDER